MPRSPRGSAAAASIRPRCRTTSAPSRATPPGPTSSAPNTPRPIAASRWPRAFSTMITRIISGSTQFLRRLQRSPTIDLNTGDVKSYGIELEGVFKPTPQWTLSGGGSLMHARLHEQRHLHGHHRADAGVGSPVVPARLEFQPQQRLCRAGRQGRPDLQRGPGWQGQPDPGQHSSARRRSSRTPGTARAEGLCPGQRLAHLSHRRDRGRRLRQQPVQQEIFRILHRADDAQFSRAFRNSDVGIIGDKRRYGVRTRFRF